MSSVAPAILTPSLGSKTMLHLQFHIMGSEDTAQMFSAKTVPDFHFHLLDSCVVQLLWSLHCGFV